jgi:hypothetical protein
VLIYDFGPAKLWLRGRNSEQETLVQSDEDADDFNLQENFDKRDKKRAQITFPLRHFFPLKAVK